MITEDRRPPHTYGGQPRAPLGWCGVLGLIYLLICAVDRPVRPVSAPLGPAPLRDLVREAAQRARSVVPRLEVPRR